MSSQQAEWGENVNILSTTRLHLVFGLTVLVMSSFQLYRSIRTSDESYNAVVADRIIFRLRGFCCEEVALTEYT